MTTTATYTAEYIFAQPLTSTVGIGLECIAESLLKARGYQFEDCICTPLEELVYIPSSNTLKIVINLEEESSDYVTDTYVQIGDFLRNFLKDSDLGTVTTHIGITQEVELED